MVKLFKNVHGVNPTDLIILKSNMREKPYKKIICNRLNRENVDKNQIVLLPKKYFKNKIIKREMVVMVRIWPISH